MNRLTLILLLSALLPTLHAMAQPIPGDTLEAFDVKPFVGTEGSVERFYGKRMTLLYFWTATDYYNQISYNALAAYADSAMREHPGLNVVTISLDRYAEDFLAWRQFMQSALNDLPNCRLDYSDYDDDAEAFLGIERLPYYLLVDSAGTVLNYEAALEPMQVKISGLTQK
ncbi:MAG: TlpA family protein disulfide reductase [Bacteroidota bacterium]